MYYTNSGEINAIKKLEKMEVSEIYEHIYDREYKHNLFAAHAVGRKLASKYLKPAAEVKAISDQVNLEAQVDMTLYRISEMIEDAAKVGHNFVIVSEDTLDQRPYLRDIVSAALEDQGYHIDLMETDDTCPDGYGEFESLDIPFYKISW